MFILALLCLAPIEVRISNTLSLSDFDIFLSTDHFAGDVTFDRSDGGVLAIIDPKEKQLVYIREERGELIRRVGRKGQGPGELQNPQAVRWIPRQKVFAVLDFNTLRISKFDLDGTLIDQYRLEERPYYPSFFDNGKLLYIRNVRGIRDEKPSLIMHDLESKKETVIFDHPAPPIWRFNRNVSNGVKTGFITLDWDAALVYSLGSDFIVTSFSDTNTLQIIGFDGKPKSGAIPVDMPTYPITRDHQAAYISELPKPVQQVLNRDLVCPDYWPVVQAIRCDGRGQVWVFGLNKNPSNSHPMKVFSREGKFISEGEIESIPEVITEQALYYLGRNEEDDVLLVVAAYSL